MSNMADTAPLVPSSNVTGTIRVESMTDRELLEELVTSTREFRAALAGAGEALSGHPMLKMFGGLGGLLGGK